MKKIVSFEKEIDFPSMIGEVSSISIDHSLKFIDEVSILGNINIFGTYKMTEASTLEEKFNYDMPVDITLTERVDYNDAKISIDDFHYEIKNDDTLKCNIDILIDAIEEVTIDDGKEMILKEQIEELKLIDKEDLEEKKIDVVEETVLEELDDLSVRECDGDKKEEKEIDVEEVKEEIVEKQKEMIVNNDINIDIDLDIEEKDEMKEEKPKNISSLFEVLNDAEETFTTYSVYILRKEDTIETIMDKYKITKEELSNYNDLNNLEIGSKVIIPTVTNE